MEYLVKPITYDDYIDAVSMFRQACKESRYKDCPMNEDKFIAHLDASIDEPDARMAFKCTYEDVMVGLYIAHVTDMDPFDVKIGVEWGFYVTPDHRGSTAGLKLDDGMMEWMRDKGVSRVINVIHFQDDNSLTYKFCEHKGAKEIGRVFERIV